MCIRDSLYMDNEEYSRLRGAGCAFQLNLFSLTGMYGERVEKRAPVSYTHLVSRTTFYTYLCRY